MVPSSLIHFLGRKFLFIEYCAPFRVANSETTQQFMYPVALSHWARLDACNSNCCVNEVLGSGSSCLEETAGCVYFKKSVAEQVLTLLVKFHVYFGKTWYWGQIFINTLKHSGLWFRQDKQTNIFKYLYWLSLV